MLWEKERDVARQGPDFRHIDTWIFDLDNTLYRAESKLFTQIDEKMGAYIRGPDGRRRRRGATPAEGLLPQLRLDLARADEHHGIEPHHFLDYVHDVDLRAVTPHPAA